MCEWPQIAVEADDLFSGVLTDIGETIDYNPDGMDLVLTIFDYVEAMRCQLWETAFYIELGGDNGAHKNNPPDKQPFFLQAVRRVLYRYFRYVLLPRKAISKVPPFFPNYLDTDSPDSMFTPAILKAWDPIHYQHCGWYLDRPLKKPPPFDIALRDSIQPLLPSPAASLPVSQSPTHPGGSSRSKTESKGNKPRGSKRKAGELLEDPMEEDTPATRCEIGDPHADPPTELADPPRASTLKRLHLGVPNQDKPIRFIAPAVKAMSSSHAFTSSPDSSRVLILNDSFHGMLDYKSKHNKFPSTYNEMVGFLSEVYFKLCSYSIQLARQFKLHSYSQIHSQVNDMVFLCWQVGASREFLFSGKMVQKAAVDLIIAEYPDGLHIPGVSDFPGQVPHWNKQVQNFVKFTIGFCQGYLHDDGAMLLFYHDSVQIKKEVLSFLYNNNLEVKVEWTIVNSLRLTHPVHPSMEVSNFGNFSSI